MAKWNDLEFQKIWNGLVKKLEEQFGEGLELEGILYLVGIQELGKGPLKLGKRQKLEVLHIAVCRLLEPYGYYVYVGTDPEGWPHFEPTEMLPSLTPGQQHKLMKEALVDYFGMMEPGDQ